MNKPFPIKDNVKIEVQNIKNNLSNKSLKSEKFLDREEKAKIELENIQKNLKKDAQEGSEKFKKELDKSNLTKQEKEKAEDIFSKMILAKLEKISDHLYKELKEGKGKLYSLMLSETVIDILDAIGDFKAMIDQYLPIPSDAILKMAAPIIVQTISTAYPGIGLLIKATGIVDKTADFLETHTLKNTISKLKEDLAKLREENELEAKDILLAGNIGVSTKDLNNMGIQNSKFESLSKSVKHFPEVKTFIKEINSFADKILPENEKDINNVLKSIKDETIKALKSEKASAKLIDEVTKQIDLNFSQVKEEMKKSLSPNAKIFDKVFAQQDSSKLALSCARKISQIIEQALPEKKQLATKVTGVLTKEIKAKMQGNVDKVISSLTDPNVKKIAKDVLGAGHVNLMKLKKEVNPNKGTGRSR